MNPLSPISRMLAIALICVVHTQIAAAFETPPCAPPDLVILKQSVADTLISASLDDSQTVLTFAGAAPALQALSSLDLLYLPPTAALVTGLQTRVIDIDYGPTETTVTTFRRDRWPQARGAGLGNLVQLVTPDGGDRDCDDTGTPVDSNFDGVFDQGTVAGNCARNNGGEFGFQLTLAEGVKMNGSLSVAPFDFDTSASFENLVLQSASFSNTGRVSFSGELIADADATLDDLRPVSIGSFLVASHQVDVPGLGVVSITISADVYAGACGTVTAGTRAGLTATGIADIGISIGNGELAQLIAGVGDSLVDASPPQLGSDAAADVTIYGGGVLRTRIDLLAGGVLPFGAAEIDLVVRGSARAEVDPDASPWWRISGRPEVFVDLSPELFTADLTAFTFDIINPPATTFFTSDDEFPFPVPDAARSSSDGGRESGSALRWSRAFLSEESFSTVDIAPTADGGALIVARSPATGALIRTDYQGERLWQRRVEGGSTIQDGRELADGSFLIGGVQGAGLWLARVSNSGALLWAREIDLPGSDIQSLRITKAANGQVTLGGEMLDLSNGNDFTPWAANINADGSVNWLRRYGQPTVAEEILEVIGLSDGGVLLVGESDETPPGPTLTGSNAYTLRLMPDGSVGWSHVWASSNGERLLSAVQAPDGSYLVGGQTGGTNLDAAPRGLLIRLDEDSQAAPTSARWIRAVSGSRNVPDTVFDEVKGLVNVNGGFMLTGSSRLGADRRGWLGRLVERDNRVDLIWSYFHDGLDDDNLVSLTSVGDGVLAGGTSRSFADGALDNALWLARAPLNGYLGWNGPSNATATPTALVLGQAPGYPSFADSLNITSEAMTTALEQAVDLEYELTDLEALRLGPIGFAPAELVRAPLPFLDSDGDQISDALDNCTLAANVDQRDTNEDGYGNLCDADLNNDGVTNAIDLGLFRAVFFTADADADLNGDGVVNAVDLGIFRQLFFAPPGPSGIAQ